MATYAAVVSLFHVLDNINTYRVCDPKFLSDQKTLLQSLDEYVIVLQQVLENWSSCSYSNKGFESRIVDAAYKAEDVVEIYIMDYLEAKRKNELVFPCDVRMRSDHFSVELQIVLDKLESLLLEVVEIKESNNSQVQQPRHFAPEVPRTRDPPGTQNRSVRLFPNDMNQVMDKLTGNGQKKFLTCSLVGMGGTGKTTLAKSIFLNPFIVNHFDIRGWVTVSQEFNPRELLVILLRETYAHFDEGLINYHQLGEILYKHLFDRRYLIVMDDVWDIEALGKLKVFFPMNNNGSRVLVTTRISDVGVHSVVNHRMLFLNEEQSWELLTGLVFGNESCPSKLEKILKIISRNCRGLLLSLSVIGGLIANSDMTPEYLEYIAKDTTAIVNSDDEDHCLEILSTSYNHLPVHLKPCFLYFGCFEEDETISIAKLIKLWVPEGFLKPSQTKSLEEAAKDYLTDLIRRNLIFVNKFGNVGSMEHCKIHDLWRDFCLREAYIDNFIYVTKFRKRDTLQGFNYRRVVIRGSNRVEETLSPLDNALQSSVYPRSLTFSSRYPLCDVKLLRVLSGKINPRKEYFKMFNLRFISGDSLYWLPQIHLCWNLQTLYIKQNHKRLATFDLWEMPLLRHVSIDNGSYLTDPSVGKTEVRDTIVLKNLHTLGTVKDFVLTEDVLRRIPNVKKLRIRYSDVKQLPNSYLENLASLQKLESLSCLFNFCTEEVRRKQSRLFRIVEIPLSLKELHLVGCNIDWEDVGRNIGPLPCLEILTLCCELSEEWNTFEGQFLRLKVLRIINSNLVRWTTESAAHFPRLEHLLVRNLGKLEEIPSEIGDIQTLQSIQVIFCADSVRDSATRILQEQRSYGNEDLKITIYNDIGYGLSLLYADYPDWTDLKWTDHLPGSGPKYRLKPFRS